MNLDPVIDFDIVLLDFLAILVFLFLFERLGAQVLDDAEHRVAPINELRILGRTLQEAGEALLQCRVRHKVLDVERMDPLLQ
mgnify:CR=1 FL=1